MFTLDVRADFGPAIAQLNAMSKGLGDQVVVPALNKTIATTNTMMVRAISAYYNVKQSDIRDKLSIVRASRKGGNFEATLFGNPFGTKRRALNLIRFLQSKKTLAAYRRKGARGTDVLQFQIQRGQTIQIPGTFVLNVPGNPIFKRMGKGRKAIEPAYAPGIPQLFMTHRVQDPIKAAIPAEFAKQFKQAMRYFVSKL